ncbi:Uncharacterised protein [Chlamydia trachomatis]|nr:Uncharacterised protein [Chlamydia trachomatis]
MLLKRKTLIALRNAEQKFKKEMLLLNASYNDFSAAKMHADLLSVATTLALAA